MPVSLKGSFFELWAVECSSPIVIVMFFFCFRQAGLTTGGHSVGEGHFLAAGRHTFTRDESKTGFVQTSLKERPRQLASRNYKPVGMLASENVEG